MDWLFNLLKPLNSFCAIKLGQSIASRMISILISAFNIIISQIIWMVFFLWWKPEALIPCSDVSESCTSDCFTTCLGNPHSNGTTVFITLKHSFSGLLLTIHSMTSSRVTISESSLPQYRQREPVRVFSNSDDLLSFPAPIPFSDF